MKQQTKTLNVTFAELLLLSVDFLIEEESLPVDCVFSRDSLVDISMNKIQLINRIGKLAKPFFTQM